ncbi:MAG: GvpL/GvpF family gas vesicle protein [Candidatus Fermentithermobacillus carboniphilus]|uniref:GvpL/GvpF family gas vesicle protein n=1 Tax=Candidatus Fermentithermobacillus carboniphilus TaxID=3085328 RepID=A0AAT9LEY6_9FIRM|nr:MAG: GvpL/GvpF family gas vesicle protein [Candidatus Fermentithermobacillus carboniphilus]
MTSFKYIYGIIPGSHEITLPVVGIDGAQVYTIFASGLSAVISTIEDKAVDPTRKNLQAHLAVQTRLMGEFTLLPAAFGMVADSDEDIKHVLQENHSLFESEIKKVYGKVEAAVQVMWNREAVLAELDRVDPEFSRLRKELARVSPDEARGLMVQIGKKVEELSSRWQNRYGSAIHHELKTASEDAVLHSIAAPQCILNASYLVDKRKEREFSDKMSALGAQHAGKLEFKYTPNLPPYSFVELRIQGR